MGAKNKVIAGDYEGKQLIQSFGIPSIINGLGDSIKIDKNIVESYELMDESKNKSASSAIGRGLIGGVILGPIGLLAAASAKTKGVYVLAINFKDGKKSLIEVDEKIYKAIITKCF